MAIYILIHKNYLICSKEKKYMELKIKDIQGRYNNLCRSIENECVDECDYKRVIEEEALDSERFREIPPNDDDEEDQNESLKDYNPPLKHFDRSSKKNDDSRISSSERKHAYIYDQQKKYLYSGKGKTTNIRIEFMLYSFIPLLQNQNTRIEMK